MKALVIRLLQAWNEARTDYANRYANHRLGS
jgi:hypothetical protein